MLHTVKSERKKCPSYHFRRQKERIYASERELIGGVVRWTKVQTKVRVIKRPYEKRGKGAVRQRSKRGKYSTGTRRIAKTLRRGGEYLQRQAFGSTERGKGQTAPSI